MRIGRHETGQLEDLAYGLGDVQMVTPHILLLLLSIATLASALLWSRGAHAHTIARFHGAAALTIGAWLIGYYAIIHVIESGSPAASLMQAAIYVTAIVAVLELVQLALKPRHLGWWRVGAAAAGIVIVWAKLSHHIYGVHLPVFYFAKWTVATVMLATVAVCAVALSSDSARRSIGVGLLIVPVAAVVDLWVLPRGFVSSRLPLGTGYPLTLTSFLGISLFRLYRFGVGAEPTSEVVGLRETPGGTSVGEQGFEAYLTARESDVVSLLRQGLSNREIGERLFISESTVKNHLHNIYEKLGVTGRVELLSRIYRQQ